MFGELVHEDLSCHFNIVQIEIEHLPRHFGYDSGRYTYLRRIPDRGNNIVNFV
jgi:hypothetical protein